MSGKAIKVGLAFPDVALYNQPERSPQNFSKSKLEDMKKVDLLIVLGCSLRAELTGINCLLMDLASGMDRFKNIKPRTFWINPKEPNIHLKTLFHRELLGKSDWICRRLLENISPTLHLPGIAMLKSGRKRIRPQLRKDSPPAKSKPDLSRLMVWKKLNMNTNKKS